MLASWISQQDIIPFSWLVFQPSLPIGIMISVISFMKIIIWFIHQTCITETTHLSFCNHNENHSHSKFCLNMAWFSSWLSEWNYSIITNSKSITVCKFLSMLKCVIILIYTLFHSCCALCCHYVITYHGSIQSSIIHLDVSLL